MATYFLDTHLHIWNPDRLSYGWLADAAAILNQVREPLQIQDEAKASGLRQAILVQAANTPDETDYLLAEAKKHDWIVGVVGWVDLLNPAMAARQLRELTKNPYIKGVRHLIHGEAKASWLLQEPVLESLALVADHNLTYDVVGINLAHLDCAIAISQRVPTLQLVLDHLNQPPIDFDRAVDWKARMQAAASFPNVAAKISSLGTATKKGLLWSQVDIYFWVQFAVETFGVDRLMLGSDWPVCLLAGTYQHTIEQYQGAVQQLVSPSDAEKIFVTNAQQIYRL